MSLLKEIRERTAKDLNVPLEMVNSIIDFQWDFIKAGAHENEAISIEITTLGVLHWRPYPAKKYLWKMYFLLGRLHENLEIPERERKMYEVREHIKKITSKVEKHYQRFPKVHNEDERIQSYKEEDMPE